MSRQNDLRLMDGSPSKSPRQQMYKKSPANWKETFRKRCKERLRESRTKLFAKRRGLQGSNDCDDDGDGGSVNFIKNLMTEEFQSLKAEQADDREMMMWDPESGQIDEMLSVFEEIQRELLAEEARLLQEYEFYEESLNQVRAQEEAALCCAMELLSAREVRCPVCEKHPLMQNKGVIFCKCGVRINTEQDCISLEYVQRQLEEATKNHPCDSHPHFSVIENFGCTNLVMTCDTCEFMFIVV